jgi:hypothetical protein
MNCTDFIYTLYLSCIIFISNDDINLNIVICDQVLNNVCEINGESLKFPFIAVCTSLYMAKGPHYVGNINLYWLYDLLH